MIRYVKMLGGLLLASALVACGGGGGSAGTTNTGGGSTGGTGSTSGTGSTATSSGSMQLAIFNAAGTQVTSVDSAGGYTARATVSDANGSPVASRAVTFALTDASIATLTPTTALSNSSGVAQVAIAPASLTTLGAATLSASATVGTATLSVKTDFGVSASNLSLSAVSVGSASLPSGGNTSIAVTANVNGAAASSTPVNVSFSTTCGRINSQGNSFSATTNGAGVASATYTAVNSDGTLCSGSVVLTASASGASPQTATINVAAPSANAVTFVAATPQQIFVAGSGALEQSNVTFKVLAGTSALPNQTVTFSLQVNPGGVGLNATGSATPVTATTDANGQVSVSVFSGTIPGPVKVRAALASNASVFAETQNLTVASGPPSQRFMSLSVQTYNIEGWGVDGTPTKLTVRLADRQGNAVADGTVVNFTAEGGQVASSCATQQVGGISSCSVDFISQNPRPAGGRVSVLAYTNGTKDYVDNNGNNRYDAGDTLIDIGDAYRDDNEDGTFNPGEFLIPRGGTLACSGSGEPFPSRANTCDGQLATTVRQQAVILFSSSQPALKNVFISPSQLQFNLASQDNTLLPMPAGTSLSVTTRDQTATNSQTCAVTDVLPSTVPNVAPTTNPNADISTRHQVLLIGCASGDQVVIKVTSPSGLVTPFAAITIP